ncbi:DHA2 family efflux MFS transporter permease subunit [Mycobacterium sp. E796]|uniref:DHA2 family efflux MFS transporter permease subunit n=1 Tax=Mycobacterium sp. E796 TaxID=1834151 RepID=UPI0007FE71CB|nr:DHA2 family efflux MFS transporter permease subunit [Mycobacterium sp. E796]OBI67840.1 MFS transporter [Mycobacterium sp. E796]
MATVVVAAVFMSNLDLWIVNVALVDIGRGFGNSLSAASWVLNAYAIALAALLIPAGRLGDRFGQRRVFLIGIAVFTVASLACAVAPNLAILVAARVLQSVGAAAQLPTSLALLMASVEPHRRTNAARGWAAVGGLAAVCGPVLGGLLVTVSWRWVFLVNLPVGLAAWLLGRRVLPFEPARRDERMPDLVGSALLIVAVAALTGALVQAPIWGWVSAGTVALAALALLGTAAFLWRTARHPHPLLELPLLKIRNFAVANVAFFCFGAAFAIMLLSNSLWCQNIWHYSVLRTGLAMAPSPALVPIVTFGSARLVHRIGPGPVAAIGSALFAASLVWRIVFAGAAPHYVTDLLPSMLLSGIGVGLTLSTLMAAGATALPPARAATGSALVNSGRQVASALGVAILVTALGPTASVRDFDLGWWLALAFIAATVVISLTLPHVRSEVSASAAVPGRSLTDQVVEMS